MHDRHEPAKKDDATKPAHDAVKPAPDATDDTATQTDTATQQCTWEICNCLPLGGQGGVHDQSCPVSVEAAAEAEKAARTGSRIVSMKVEGAADKGKGRDDDDDDDDDAPGKAKKPSGHRG